MLSEIKDLKDKKIKESIKEIKEMKIETPKFNEENENKITIYNNYEKEKQQLIKLNKIEQELKHI